MHGGSVRAFSPGLNQGSEFVVRLPVLTSAVPAAKCNGKMPAPKPASPRRVLVVDDNIDGAESLAMVLQFSGHEVRCVHDGLSGLSAAEDFEPDLILLDIGLPGMDGFEVARQLRRRPRFKNVFLVALTGYGRDEDRRLAEEAGFDLHLVKPVDPDTLTRLLARVPSTGQDSASSSQESVRMTPGS